MTQMDAERFSAALKGSLHSPQGKVFDMPDPMYRKVAAISKSGLDLVAENPARYQWEILLGNKPEPTAAMRLGSAFDSALLTPDLFCDEYVLAPEGIRRGSKAWEEFEKAAASKTILKPEEMQSIQGMRDAVKRHSTASKILSEGDPQVSLFWSDPIHSVPCKARLDFLRPDGIIVDVKTTGQGGASPEVFQRTAHSFRYHCQAAFYSDGLSFIDRAAEAFVFIVIEREPPHAIAIYSLDQDFTSLGRETYQRDLDRFAECQFSGAWPSYPTEIQPLSAPAWALKKGSVFA